MGGTRLPLPHAASQVAAGIQAALGLQISSLHVVSQSSHDKVLFGTPPQTLPCKQIEECKPFCSSYLKSDDAKFLMQTASNMSLCIRKRCRETGETCSCLSAGACHASLDSRLHRPVKPSPQAWGWVRGGRVVAGLQWARAPASRPAGAAGAGTASQCRSAGSRLLAWPGCEPACTCGPVGCPALAAQRTPCSHDRFGTAHQMLDQFLRAAAVREFLQAPTSFMYSSTQTSNRAEAIADPGGKHVI